MSAWLTVYCTRPVRHVTGKDILLCLDFEDPYAFAESLGIDDDDAVDAALTNLQIEANSEEPRFSIHFVPADGPSVYVHYHLDTDEVATLVREVSDEISRKGKGIRQVRRCLASTVEIVSLELGWSQVGTMGIVLASRVTELFAEMGHGLIRDQNGDWWAIGADGPVLVYPQD